MAPKETGGVILGMPKEILLLAKKVVSCVYAWKLGGGLVQCFIGKMRKCVSNIQNTKFLRLLIFVSVNFVFGQWLRMKNRVKMKPFLDAAPIIIALGTSSVFMLSDGGESCGLFIDTIFYHTVMISNKGL